MIKSFLHKGLRKFYENGSLAGVQSNHQNRIRMVLAALETSAVISDMDISCFGLHRLKGELNGRWSVYVSGNWRATFRFEGGHAYDLNYEDYH